MAGRNMLGLLITICAAYVFVCPCEAAEQPPKAEFKIGTFVVRVEASSVLINGQRPTGGIWRPSSSSSDLSGKVFSGRGRTMIKSSQVAVTFQGVTLFLDRGAFVATTGVVSGVPGNVLQYPIQAFNIQIERQSIKITPDSAKAKITVLIPIASFSADTIGNLSISSTTCHFSSDGSLYGRDFHGAAALSLKGARYGFRIRENNALAVLLGDAFRGSGLKPGITLNGTASRETMEVFEFNGMIYPDATAIFNLTLRQQIVAYPEIGYMLTLKRGTIQLQYGLTSLQNASGSFAVDISVPESIKNEADQSIMLRNIILETDKTDALYRKLTISGKLKAGSPFLIEPAKDRVWAYFPKWPLQPGYSSYPNKPDCATLDQFLDQSAGQSSSTSYNADKRPGLTILEGILYLSSPQITADGVQAVTVKTAFSGALTLTPWGLTGPLSGRGYSFVRLDQDIVLGTKTNVPPRKTWEQIIHPATGEPQKLTERFQLANLRILDMYLKEMHLCMNEIEEGKATLNYAVHFPFPSYINLEFEDKTLNRKGLFAQAKGPIATQTLDIPRQYSTPADLSRIPKTLPKDTTLTPNPDTYILWAWRLPVSFADRGVVIDYAAGSPKDASVKVVLDATRQINGSILSSEIWLKPLYSANSAIRSGVRFSATMDSKQGNFKLTEWDPFPYLSRRYGKPGTERKVGFWVQLNDLSGEGIKLADSTSDPGLRPYDVRWVGKIQFPFFSDEAKNTWKEVAFEVKDLEPKLPVPLQMTAERGKVDCSISSSGECLPQNLADPPLRVEVDQLAFVPGQTIFSVINDRAASPILRAFDVREAGTSDLWAVSLNISSYSNALLTTSIARPDPRPLDVGGGDAPLLDECGRNNAKWIRRIMKDWEPSTFLRDLVCYDVNSSCTRKSCGICSADFVLGTYEVRTRNCQDLSKPECGETAILSIPNAKYYQSLKILDTASTDVTVKSDEMADSHPTVINIPSAQFAFSPDGRFLEGAFGATLSTVAAALPYEGELRFKLDTKCGYFYFQGAGSFTYYVRFSGQTFIVHAPYRFLLEPSVFEGVSDILEDLRIRALFDSVDEFTKAAGLGLVSPTTVISGVFTSGNASKEFSIGVAEVGAALGPGLYLYQFKDPNDPQASYQIGTFAKVRASAGIDVLGFGVDVEGQGTLAASGSPPKDLSSLEAIISKGDYSAEGNFKLKGDACFIIGCCEGWLDFPGVSLSTSSGFNLGDFSTGGDCR